MFERVTILSPGLLGASLAMAIREKKLANSIHIWAHRETTRQKCRDKPWQDNVCETFEQAVKDADLVIICSPVEHIVGLTGDISPYLKKGALVTDVGSTKEEICHPCHTALSSDAYFVGAHPMAGSEKSGLEYADSMLFEGKPCFITPLPESVPHAVAAIQKFWQALGMHTHSVSPDVHDAIVASISHLPYLVAACLCKHVGAHHVDSLQYASSGFRDTTRVAGSNPFLWREIVEKNRKAILKDIISFEKELRELKAILQKEDKPALLQFLKKAKNCRDLFEGMNS